MSHTETRSPHDAAARERSSTPSVLVVLVCRNAEEWLRQSLIALSRQTYARIGVLAVDNASADDSVELLRSTLGPERVIALSDDRGFSGAAAEALATPAGERADYLLLLHDDTVLAPDAVASLVEVAERIDDAGIVGPKVLDVERSEILRDVGLSADRFGYPYSPLEDGEIDQGQYDGVREVLAVSSCAMLVARPVFERVGLPDERLATRFADVEFGWRARIAGFRVLMTPRAVAAHRDASARGQRPGSDEEHPPRYERERAALASTLRNYALLSLGWVLPLWVVQAAVRELFLLVSRRFEDAYQILAAVGWNLRHLPGTLTRRRKTQRARMTRDHRVDQFLAPSDVRLRRWALTATQVLRAEPSETDEGQDGAAISGPVRAARFAVAHPVMVAWMAATVVAAVAYRHLAGASPLDGGSLAAFPASASGFFNELVSGLRSTGLGGSQAASPALGLLGVGSVVAFGSPALLQKILLLVLPAAAGVGCYRAVRSACGARAPAVVAGGCYALSAVALWGISEGLIPELVFLSGLPWIVSKLWSGFAPQGTTRSHRWLVGAATGLAVLASFFPGTLLAVAVIAGAAMVVPPAGAARVRGLGRAAVAVLGAGILLFPLGAEIATAGGNGLAALTGPGDFGQILRLSPGPAPGAWVIGYYLPLAAALCLTMVSGATRRTALRAAVAAIAAVYLGWAAAAGWLPLGMSNPAAYVGVAAFCYALLVGLGLASLAAGVSRSTFGYRQLGGGLLTLVVAGGLIGQAAQACRGAWAVGQDNVPAAYALVADAPGPAFRVLFVGRLAGGALVPPGGEAQGYVQAGQSSVRFAVNGPSGSEAFDFGRPAAGSGYNALSRVLGQVLSGTTSNGGALLAPFGITFVVAAPGDLPDPVLRTLGAQVDLDVMPAGGLTIYRNAATVGTAAVVGPSWSRAAFGAGSAVDDAMVDASGAVALTGGGQRYGGSSAPRGSLVLLSQQFDRWWRLGADGRTSGAKPAFGWAVGFPAGDGLGPFQAHFSGQWIRTLEMVLLTLLWACAMWVTRRPSGGG